MRILKTALACAMACMIGLAFNPVKIEKNAAAEEINTEKSNHVIHEDIVTIVNEQTDLFQTIANGTEEDYRPVSRKWVGMPSVITAGKNIFVAWQTGGQREPDPDKLNYITVAASIDGGITWKDPFMIIDPLDQGVQAQVPQFYYNHAGELNLLFSYEGVGIHAIVLHGMDGDLANVTYEEPVFTGVANSSFTKPTLVSDGSIMYLSGKSDARVIRSEDDGKSFQIITQLESLAPAASRVFAESTIVEKKDGILWGMRRLENSVNGGIEQSFSADKGKTWTISQGNLPAPLTSPGSRFAMQRLKSGNLLFITNAAGMGTNRQKMTAYLSTDDGDSWPYSLLLDPTESSYPDFWQDEDGKIYIAFDKDRYGEGGMRLCIVTEDDVKAGKYVSEGAQQLITLTKINTDYGDIKSVNGAFPSGKNYKVGTDVKTILDDLPTTIKVTDEYGRDYEITGKYRAAGYNKDQAGTYKIYFIATLPATLKDSFSKLEFEINLVESTGCASSLSVTMGAVGVAVIGVVMAAAAEIGCKKKRNPGDQIKKEEEEKL
ncbi:MAG: sialidase family protein [Candidatus Borkfalkiaceae bacterium]|nr:sialidase family protein [Clostridia bacterium]MDY6222563.1 sialidase family protein [Christensenellaceae bacterium]